MSGARPKPNFRSRPYTLAPVPNQGIPERKVILHEARIGATGVWVLIAMEDVP